MKKAGIRRSVKEKKKKKIKKKDPCGGKKTVGYEKFVFYD